MFSLAFFILGRNEKSRSAEELIFFKAPIKNFLLLDYLRLGGLNNEL